VIFLVSITFSSQKAPIAEKYVGSRQSAALLHPTGELSFVEFVVLVDVEVARVLALGLAGRDRTQRRAAEESHFDVVREVEEQKISVTIRFSKR
jgi:hypothetical protein